MLHLNLSVLGRPELERLLEVARARGQEAFVLELEAELRARAAGVTPSAPVHGFAEEEPLAMAVPDAPDERDLGSQGPDDGLRVELARERRPPRRIHLGLVAAAALAGVVAVAAWGLGGLPGRSPPGHPMGEPASGPAASAPPAAAPPPAAPPVRGAVRPDAPPEPAAPPLRLAQSRQPEAAARVQSDLAAIGAAVDAVARPRRLDPCAAPPTPADRALCSDLALNLLERELRDAYARALDAGADPARLRADQTAWRAARAPVSDSRALARLYDRRIRELKDQAADVPPAAGPAPENIR